MAAISLNGFTQISYRERDLLIPPQEQQELLRLSVSQMTLVFMNSNLSLQP